SRAAGLGDPQAQFALAQLYVDGRGVIVDEGIATHWMQKAAAQGHAAAQLEYAIRLFKGIGTDKDEAGAAIWFQRAAKAGNPAAQNRLARLLAAGLGLEADPVAAAKWHLIASRAGNEDEWLDDFVAKLPDDERPRAGRRSRRRELPGRSKSCQAGRFVVQRRLRHRPPDRAAGPADPAGTGRAQPSAEDIVRQWPVPPFST